MDEVFKLPKKKKEVVPDTDLMGLPELFEKLEVNPRQEQVPLAVDTREVEVAETEMKDDGIMVPNKDRALGQETVVPGEVKQKIFNEDRALGQETVVPGEVKQKIPNKNMTA